MQTLYLWWYGTLKALDGDIFNHAKYTMQKHKNEEIHRTRNRKKLCLF